MPNSIQVLYVEDDLAVAELVRLRLLHAKMRVATATCVADAMQAITAGLRPDVLLLDYWLEDEATGADLAERIARYLQYRIPTIILSGDLFNVEVPWIPGTPLMLAAKPLDSDKLLDTLRLFANWHRGVQRRLSMRRAEVFRKAS